MEIQIQHLESPITAFDQKEPLVGILSFVRQLDLPRLFKGVAGTEMGPFCWSPWFPEIHLGRFSNREGLTAHHQGHQFTTGRLTWCEMAWGKVYLGIQPKVGCPKKNIERICSQVCQVLPFNRQHFHPGLTQAWPHSDLQYFTCPMGSNPKSRQAVSHLTGDGSNDPKTG